MSVNVQDSRFLLLWGDHLDQRKLPKYFYQVYFCCLEVFLADDHLTSELAKGIPRISLQMLIAATSNILGFHVL